MANIIASPQQPHHALQGSRRTDLVVRATCLVDKVCLYGKVLISVNKLTCRVVLRRQGIAYDAMRMGRVLTLLVLLIMALQTSVVTIIFSKMDSTWIEAIAAALGVVSNTAAIYLGFSANIRKLRAALVHDQDAQEAQLPHQN